MTSRSGTDGFREATPEAHDSALHEVRLLRLPISLHARAQQHSAELMREMYLIAQQLHGEAETMSSVMQLPARLVELVELLGNEYNHLTFEQDRQLDGAVAVQLEEIDLVYRVPVSAAVAAERLGEMLDAADEFCRQGRHLLTLATPVDLLRYRQWFLGEFVTQLGGGPATPWPQFAGMA